MSLIASILFGTTSALGESTSIGFLKDFPSSTVGFFGSGTGFAGVFGSGSILILSSFGLPLGAVYILMTPTFLIYYLSFFWLNSKHKRYYKK